MPCNNQAPIQISNVEYGGAVDTLLHDAPYFIVLRIQVGSQDCSVTSEVDVAWARSTKVSRTQFASAFFKLVGATETINKIFTTPSPSANHEQRSACKHTIIYVAVRTYDRHDMRF